MVFKAGSEPGLELAGAPPVGEAAAKAIDNPLELLALWLSNAREGEAVAPAAMTLVTATRAGRPSARVVSLKRLEADALVFTTALWTRKVAELRRNPTVAAVLFWPALGRQVRLNGEASIAERKLAEELFGERPRSHQLQAHVSRQGEAIAGLEQLQAQLDALKVKTAGRQIDCPKEWGAIRIRPESIEFWQEGAERLHDRHLYEREGEGWRYSRLAP